MRVFPNGTGILLGLLICFAGAWFFPGGAEWADFLFPVSKSSILVVVIFLIHGWNVRLDVIALVFRGFPNLLFVLGGMDCFSFLSESWKFNSLFDYSLSDISEFLIIYIPFYIRTGAELYVYYSHRRYLQSSDSIEFSIGKLWIQIGH